MEYEQTINMIKEYVNLKTEQKISLEELARLTNYSARQLNRIFAMRIGITVGEYLRYARLCKALYDLKYTKTPIIEIAYANGYESQESFTRAFKEQFHITPGDCRSYEQSILIQNSVVRDFIHQESHEAKKRGMWKMKDVEVWTVEEPERIWAIARRNHENLEPNAFYELCGREGVMQKTGALADVVREGGAIMTQEGNGNQLCFGVLLEKEYPMSLLETFEIVHIPNMKYVVFHVAKCGTEDHGDAIQSVLDAQKSFEPEEQGLEWNYGEAPIFESDQEELGYTMWFPVKSK